MFDDNDFLFIEYLQGHISFPLILDLFSSMTSGVGMISREESLQQQFMLRRFPKPSFPAESLVGIHYETRNSDDAIRESFYSNDAEDLSSDSNKTRGSLETNKRQAEQVIHLNYIYENHINMYWDTWESSKF